MQAHRAERTPSLRRNAFQIQMAPPMLATAIHTSRHGRDKSVKSIPQATPTSVKIPPVARRMYAAALTLDGSFGCGFRACLTSQGTIKNCITTAKPKLYGSNVMLISSSRLTIQSRATPTGSQALKASKTHLSTVALAKVEGAVGVGSSAV
jgi:hypothetical protein